MKGFQILTLGLSLALASGNSDRPIVITKTGGVQGIVERSFDGNEYYSFKGIPIGEPPVGDLRFAVSAQANFLLKDLGLLLLQMF